MTSPGPSPFHTAADVAEILRCSPSRVVQLCREKKLRATMPAGTWLIAPEDLRAFIEAGYEKSGRASA